MLNLVAVNALEKVLNQCLKLDPESLARVTALEGKVVAIELNGLGLRFYLVPCHDSLRVQSVFDGEPDVRISGGPVSLAMMGIGPKLGQKKGLLGDGVRFDGDAHLGREVQSIIDGLDIDWEEQLSRLCGDVLAHQIGNFVRGAHKWGTNAASTLARDVTEYFQEESRDLVPQPELAAFLDKVDTIRSDVDRLEARIKRLLSARESS